MAQSHWLSPLLTPDSVAIVGASVKEGSFGETCVRMAGRNGYGGRIYPINPNYEEVAGLPCYPSLAALPEPVDLAVLCVNNNRLEAMLEEAIGAGARSAAIFGSCYLEDDTEPRLPARLARIARAAKLPICGGNGMGFYNLDHDFLCSFGWPPYETRRGHMTLISHSGSSFSALALNDQRLGYNLAVSHGLELSGTVADFMDYALDLETTRVVGLILETVRDPEGFVAALAKAREREVPVVAVKLGRTAEAARMAISHSGAIAGDDAAYEAVFERHGVHRVETLDELAATMSLFSVPRRVGPGGLAAIGDSGGERELLVDLAAKHGVPLAEMTPETTEKLASILDPGLTPVNPVDAWGTPFEFERKFNDSFCALVEDPNTALGMVFSSVRDNAGVSDTWAGVCEEAYRRAKKPVALVTHMPWTRHPGITARMAAANTPVIEGARAALVATRGLLAFRDFLERPAIQPPPPGPAATRAEWRARLAAGHEPDEAGVLALLRDYGVPASPAAVAEGLDEAIAMAEGFGYPVVLKTAMPGIHHKSDQDGVKLGLGDSGAVAAAYADLASRLGPRVVVAPMAEAAGSAVEMALGIVCDSRAAP
jgi:acyl-CoA synthetase (NDP forming)